MFIQGVDSVYDLEWAPGVKYGQVHLENEREGSRYNFEEADTEMLFKHFEEHESEAFRLLVLEHPLVYAAYDQVIHCSHTFNLLQARGAISVNQRAVYIGRIRRLAQRVAEAYVGKREQLGFPLGRATPLAAATS
jgi:glycyl-tRNA synthetase alpha chain